MLHNEKKTSFVAMVEFLMVHIFTVINVTVTGTVSVGQKLGHWL